jgi:hypothetical protein
VPLVAVLPPALPQACPWTAAPRLDVDFCQARRSHERSRAERSGKERKGATEQALEETESLLLQLEILPLQFHSQHMNVIGYDKQRETEQPWGHLGW